MNTYVYPVNCKILMFISVENIVSLHFNIIKLKIENWNFF